MPSYSSPLSLLKHDRSTDSFHARRALRWCAAAVAALAAACGKASPESPHRWPRSPIGAIVYAINGAPLGAPTALHLYSGTLLPADANFIFDVAFDIDSSGERRVHAAARRVERIARRTRGRPAEGAGDVRPGRLAPKPATHPDTAMVVAPRSGGHRAEPGPDRLRLCRSPARRIHAKIVVQLDRRVDSHDVRLRYTVDPNCGFRSFATGIPKD